MIEILKKYYDHDIGIIPGIKTIALVRKDDAV